MKVADLLNVLVNTEYEVIANGHIYDCLTELKDIPPSLLSSEVAKVVNIRRTEELVTGATTERIIMQIICK